MPGKMFILLWKCRRQAAAVTADRLRGSRSWYSNSSTSLATVNVPLTIALGGFNAPNPSLSMPLLGYKLLPTKK